MVAYPYRGASIVVPYQLIRNSRLLIASSQSNMPYVYVKGLSIIMPCDSYIRNVSEIKEDDIMCSTSRIYYFH